MINFFIYLLLCTYVTEVVLGSIYTDIDTTSLAKIQKLTYGHSLPIFESYADTSSLTLVI